MTFGLGVPPMTIALAGLAAVVAFIFLQTAVAWVKGMAFRLAIHHLLFAAIGGIGTVALDEWLPWSISELLARGVQFFVG